MPPTYYVLTAASRPKTTLCGIKTNIDPIRRWIQFAGPSMASLKNLSIGAARYSVLRHLSRRDQQNPFLASYYIVDIIFEIKLSTSTITLPRRVFIIINASIIKEPDNQQNKGVSVYIINNLHNTDFDTHTHRKFILDPCSCGTTYVSGKSFTRLRRT